MRDREHLYSDGLRLPRGSFSMLIDRRSLERIALPCHRNDRRDPGDLHGYKRNPEFPANLHRAIFPGRSDRITPCNLHGDPDSPFSRWQLFWSDLLDLLREIFEFWKW